MLKFLFEEYIGYIGIYLLGYLFFYLIIFMEWKKTFISKAIQSQRDIIPIYFEGQNSAFFYRFAKIRKCIGLKFNIELIYLPDEMFSSKNKTFNIYIGKPIPWQTFDKSKSLQEWAQFVKEQVYQIKNQ